MTKKYIVDCGSGPIETFNTKKEALDFIMNDNESDCWDIWIDDVKEITIKGKKCKVTGIGYVEARE